MSKLTGTRCPCGGASIGIFRGEQACEKCKRIELRFDLLRPASSFFRMPTAEEIESRIERYSKYDWQLELAERIDLTPVPAPLVPEGKILVSGYAHYVL